MKFRYTGSDNLVVVIGGALRTIHPKEVITCDEDLRRISGMNIIYPKTKKIGDSDGKLETSKS